MIVSPALVAALAFPLGMVGVLAAATLAPQDGQPVLARFADDEAAIAGALAAEATPIRLLGPGLVVLAAGPDLAARLHAAGASRVIGLGAVYGCGAEAMAQTGRRE